MTKPKFAITIRVTDDTLTELHKLTANSKTTAFADVAGELLDKATAPNAYLVVVPPAVMRFYEREAINTGFAVEELMATSIAFYTSPL